MSPTAAVLIAIALVVSIAVCGGAAADHGTLRDCAIKNSAILSSGAVIECTVKKAQP